MVELESLGKFVALPQNDPAAIPDCTAKDKQTELVADLHRDD